MYMTYRLATASGTPSTCSPSHGNPDNGLLANQVAVFPKALQSMPSDYGIHAERNDRIWIILLGWKKMLPCSCTMIAASGAFVHVGTPVWFSSLSGHSICYQGRLLQ